MKASRLEQLRNLEIDASPAVWVNINKSLPQRRKRRFIFWIFSFLLIIASGVLILNQKHENKITLQKSQSGNEGEKLNHSQSVDIGSGTPGTDKIAQPINSGIGNNNTNSSTSQVAIKNNDTETKKLNSKNVSKNKSVVKSSGSPSGNNSGFASIAVPGKIAESNFGKGDEEKMQTELSWLNQMQPDLFINSPENEIVNRDLKMPSNYKLSRWSLFAGLGMSTSGYHPIPDSIGINTISIHGLNNMFFNLGAKYDISPYFRLSFGVSNLVISQERTGYDKIDLIGTPGDPANSYHIRTPLGTIFGYADVFDHTYFNSDTSLYPFVVASGPFGPEAKSIEYTIREEFTYINIPVSISYKWNGKIITTSAGLIFNSNFLTGSNLYLEGRSLKFLYFDNVSKNTFSAGAIAGLDYHLTKTFDLFLNGHYEKNLNTIIGEKGFYKPTVWRINAGFCIRLKRQ